MTAATGGLAAGAAAYAVGWLVRVMAGGRVLDHPGPRSTHAVPRTRLGGVAIAGGLLAGAAAAGAWERPLIGAVAFAMVAGAFGFGEDVRGVPIGGRLAGQALAGAIALPLLLDAPPAWAWVAALGWLVAFTNVFNFMDGIDGLAGSELFVAGLAWIAVGAAADVPVVATGGAVALGVGAGFLPHNFPPSRMFMGDLGSYSAGGWLAGVAVAGIAGGVPPLAILAPLALLVLDASWALFERLRRGEDVRTPHRRHCYQRLVDAGWSQLRTAAFVAVLASVAGVAGLLAIDSTPGTAAAAAIVAGTLAVYGLVTTRVAGRRFGGPASAG